MKERRTVELVRVVTNKLNDLHAVLVAIHTDMRGLIAQLTVARDELAQHTEITAGLGESNRIRAMQLRAQQLAALALYNGNNRRLSLHEFEDTYERLCVRIIKDGEET